MEMDAESSRQDGPSPAASFWEIERFLLGELDASEAETFRAKLAASAALRAQVERMREQVPSRTFADLRALKARRERESQAAPSPGRPAPQAVGRASWRERLRALPLLRLRPALAFLVALVAAAGLIARLQPGGRAAGPDGYQAKGGDGPEFMIRIGGIEYEPGETAPAASGDTLTLVFRSPRPAWIWTAYREDGGRPDFFAGSGPPQSPDLPWEPATVWTASPRRILLEGDWTRQDVLVLASPRPLGREEVLAFLGADVLPAADSAEGLRVFSFRLARRSAAP